MKRSKEARSALLTSYVTCTSRGTIGSRSRTQRPYKASDSSKGRTRCYNWVAANLVVTAERTTTINCPSQSGQRRSLSVALRTRPMATSQAHLLQCLVTRAAIWSRGLCLWIGSSRKSQKIAPMALIKTIESHNLLLTKERTCLMTCTVLRSHSTKEVWAVVTTERTPIEKEPQLPSKEAIKYRDQRSLALALVL